MGRPDRPRPSTMDAMTTDLHRLRIPALAPVPSAAVEEGPLAPSVPLLLTH
ncbi:hypothetical protein GZL_08269 [Streptomyces sp. 769]|nr:hypothetical protein GZL_08269 [Streptomyces sp. 769]